MPKKKKATKRKVAAAAASPPSGAKKAKGGSGSGSSWLLVDKGEIGARYADPEADSPSVGIDGIIQLAEDLQIEVEDPVFLVLAWEMQAETQGVFKRSEVSGIPHLRTLCPSSLLSATADNRAVPTCSAVAPVAGRLCSDLPRHQGLHAPRGRPEEEAAEAPCEALADG